MSRIRTVKPELFKHEDLFDAEQKSKLPLRLAFIGLFTVADCEGRFKWRPRTIKLDVLPHDFIDFATVLDALEHAGFIKRYEVDGESYGWIPTFAKHQRLQTKELTAGSSLPAPNGHDEPGTNQERYGERTGTHPEAQEGKGREEEGKGREEESAQAPNAPAPTAAPSAPCAEPTPTATAATKAKVKERAHAPSAKTSLPADFTITPELQAWADQKGYGDLNAHLDRFKDKAQAKGYQYTDWNAAFRNAVRDDWAGLRTPAPATTPRHSQRYPPAPAMTPEVAEFDAILRNLSAQNGQPILEGECSHVTH
ncbi:MAG: hypothetical protein ACOYMW_13235 [Candidatus Competibacteraceae bacterium]